MKLCRIVDMPPKRKQNDPPAVECSPSKTKAARAEARGAGSRDALCNCIVDDLAQLSSDVTRAQTREQPTSARGLQAQVKLTRPALFLVRTCAGGIDGNKEDRLECKWDFALSKMFQNFAKRIKRKMTLRIHQGPSCAKEVMELTSMPCAIRCKHTLCVYQVMI